MRSLFIKPLRAYPRVCGATTITSTWCQGTVGLSPRVRGNQTAANAPAHTDGPIPACAGQPSDEPTIGDTGRAYPRVCGATETEIRGANGIVGLSPRVRGNHATLAKITGMSGPIPACAGQPLDGEK